MGEYSERKKLHPLRYVLIGILLGLVKIVIFDRSEPATQSISSPVTSESMYATPVSSIIILVISGMIMLGCFIYLFCASRDEYVSMHDTAPVTLAFIPIFASVAAISFTVGLALCIRQYNLCSNIQDIITIIKK